MKRQRLRIAEYRHSPTTPYVLEGYRVNGRRKRIFFRTRAEAELELARLKIVLRNEGDAGAELGAEGRIEAVRCRAKLARWSKTLTDATDFLLQHLEREEKARASLTISKLIAARLARLKQLGRSPAHIDDTRFHLLRFALAYGNRPAGSLTSQEIETWLESLQLGPRSTNNYRDRLHAVFAFGCNKELLMHNPLTKIERKNVPPARTQVIAPADLQRLLDYAPQQLVPALTISYFAGLRTAEILRLTWDDINLTRGYIEIQASKAKCAQRRLVNCEPNLLEWLRPFGTMRSGPVYHGSRKQYHAEVARLFAELGIKRLSNGGRHSFASHWLAKHYDSAALASRLGHSGSRLIFTVYRELVSPETAELYWSIRPSSVSSSVPSNVIAIA